MTEVYFHLNITQHLFYKDQIFIFLIIHKPTLHLNHYLQNQCSFKQLQSYQQIKDFKKYFQFILDLFLLLTKCVGLKSLKINLKTSRKNNINNGLIQKKIETVIDNFGSQLDFFKSKIKQKYNSSTKGQRNISFFCQLVWEPQMKR